MPGQFSPGRFALFGPLVGWQLGKPRVTRFDPDYTFGTTCKIPAIFGRKSGGSNRHLNAPYLPKKEIVASRPAFVNFV